MTAERARGGNRRGALWAGAGLAIVIAAAWAAGIYADRTSEPVGEPIDAGPDSARVAEAEGFWRDLGRGDATGALSRLDPGADPTLRHYAAFGAGFGTGLEPETCRVTGPDAVRCTLRTTDGAMLALYSPGTAEYAASATVRFGDSGIEAFDLPGLVGAVSLRLFSHARDTVGIPAECDRVNYDSLDLPRYSTTLAQTGPCAEALAALIPSAVAAVSG